jgi:hypothetical protein
MKKWGILGCVVMGLVMSYMSTIYAQENSSTKPALCSMTDPISCFSAIVTANGNAETKKRKETPNDCPQGTWDLTGLSTSVLQPLCIELKAGDDSGSCSTKLGMQNLQTKLKTACGGSTCKPDSIKDPVNQLEITCSENYFNDGKYGLCTAEAVRRYLAWYKAETINCDTQPILKIDTTSNVKQGEKIEIKITATGGDVWGWEDKPAFTIKKLDLPLNIEQVTAQFEEGSPNRSIDLPPNPITLSTDIPVKFSSTGTAVIKADNGVVTEKPALQAEPDTATITVIAPDDIVTPEDKPKTELGCKQLLPKYLVGASCDEELHGDARDITYWLQRFSGQITTFIAALAVLLIAWNAFGLVMAAGDSDQLATGKKALMWVGIGLLLAVFAYVIVKTAISLSFLQ